MDQVLVLKLMSPEVLGKSISFNRLWSPILCRWFVLIGHSIQLALLARPNPSLFYSIVLLIFNRMLSFQHLGLFMYTLEPRLLDLLVWEEKKSFTNMKCFRLAISEYRVFNKINFLSKVSIMWFHVEDFFNLQG